MKLILVLVICPCLGFSVSGREERCSLRPDRGFCRGYFVRQHFNATSQTCTEFVYGGCGGNGNNFKTLEECQEVCEALTEASQSQGAEEPANTPPLDASNPEHKPSPVASDNLPGVNSNQSETSESDENPSAVSSVSSTESPPVHNPSPEDSDGLNPPVEPNSFPVVNFNQSNRHPPTDPSAGSIKSPAPRNPEKPSVFSIEPLDGRKPGKEANLIMEEHVNDIPGKPSKEEQPHGNSTEHSQDGQSHGNFTGGQSQDGQSHGNFTGGQSQDGQSQSAHNDNTANETPAADVLSDSKGPVAPDSAQTLPAAVGENTLPAIPPGESALPDCSSPAEQGPCRGLFQRFNYNRDRGTCDGFIYGGCGGNLNRYTTKEDCELMCLEAAAKPNKSAKTSSVLTTDGHAHTSADKVMSSKSSVSHTGSSGEHVK